MDSQRIAPANSGRVWFFFTSVIGAAILTGTIILWSSQDVFVTEEHGTAPEGVAQSQVYSTGDVSAHDAARFEIKSTAGSKVDVRVVGSAWTVCDLTSGVPLPDSTLAVEMPEGLHSLNADANGRIEFEGLTSSADRLAMVSAPGYCSRLMVLKSRPARPRRIGLARATEVQFVTRWKAPCQQKSLEGLEIIVMPRWRGFRSAFDQAMRRNVYTDRRGDAHVSLAPGSFSVVVRFGGVLLCSKDITVGNASQTVVVDVPCVSGVPVRVEDRASRTPIVSARFQPFHGISNDVSIESDANGVVSLPVVRGSRAAWIVRKSGYAAQKFGVTLDERGNRLKQVVQLTRAVKVLGVFVGFEGKARVKALGTVRHVGRPSVVEGETTSDGRFSVDVRADESVILFASDSNGRWALKQVDPRKAVTGELHVGQIQANAGMAINGTVLGANSEGMDKNWRYVEAGIYRLVGPEGMRCRINLATRRAPIDDHGRFRCVGLPAGEVELRPRIGRIVGKWLRKSLMTSDLDITLELGEGISGRVAQLDGEPAVSVTVVARNAKNTSRMFVRTDKDGIFQLFGLKNEAYDVEVWTGGKKTMIERVPAGAHGLRIVLRD